MQAYLPRHWDIVCEELCGQGHYTMQGTVVVLEQDEYRKTFETLAAAPTTPPTVAEPSSTAAPRPESSTVTVPAPIACARSRRAA